MADLSQIPTDQLMQMLSQHPAVQPAQASGPQPTLTDRLVASPVGRLAHDAVISPIMGLGAMLSKLDPTAPDAAKVNEMIENPYQASLAANRNTSGYAAARADADAQLRAKGGSGFTDQLLSPYLPSMAALGGLTLSGGNLDASNAAADAQSTAQGNYQKQHPGLSFGGQILGGLLATPEGAPAPLPAPTQNPTIQSVNAAKNAAYSVVDNSTMKIAAPEIQTLHADLQGKLARRGLNDQTMPKLAPKVGAAMDALKDAATSDQTLQAMDIQRRIAGIAAGSTDKSERAAARVVQDGIDDFITNLQPSQLSGPIDQAAINALPEARDLASRSFKAQQLQAIIDKAKNNSTGFAQSGYENALRVGFRKLLNNDRAIARFSPDEVAAIKQVATGGSPISATNLLRQVGKLSPQGAIPMLAELGAVGAMGPQALTIPAAGIAGRAGATALQRNAANAAVNLALRGGTPAAVTPAALTLPQLTQRSTMPFGLLTSGLLNPQSAQ